MIGKLSKRQDVRRNFRLPRIWSNRVLAKIGPLLSGDVINVSGWDDRDKEGNSYRSYFPNAENYFISNYVGERGLADAAYVTDFELDLSGPLPERFVRRFDVVYSHTTLEHIFDVHTAIDNLCKMSKDIIIVVVPFAQQVHYTRSYGDYWRFTPMGLRHLFCEHGFEVVYEAANRDRNAGIYLFFVASRNPDHWEGKLPQWQCIESLGEWIGQMKSELTIKQRLYLLVKAIARRFSGEQVDTC